MNIVSVSRVCMLAALLSAGVCEADWPRFRGPNGTGIATDSSETPVKWSPSENLRWKVELPGPGASSPIIVGERVFVTCYSGYGTSRNDVGKIEDLKRHLVCVDRAKGEILWTKTIPATLPEDPYNGMGIPAHGYASHTPVSDGERVYAFFGKSGVVCFDLEGEQLWTKGVGTGSDPKRWGSSSSPIIHDDLVIVTASAESGAIVGLNKSTGAEVWRQTADGLIDVWGTPIIAKIDQERSDLVIGVPYEFWGLNPKTGKLRWYSEAIDTDSYNSSIVEADGVIYGIEGRGGGSAAVKAGGKGDVSETNTIWAGRDTARFATPLVYNGKIYYFANGVVNCINATDGEAIFKGRLPTTANNAQQGNPPAPRGAGDQGSSRGFGGFGGFGGRGGRGGFGSMDYSSPVAADGKIYYVKSDGTTYVINASDEFELLATNQLSDSGETFSGTPAISDGQIVIRSNRSLYCIGAK
ncbi:MAG: PQQ-binding-like beta-propeller repeat protein [Rubripirellula sp.]|nr:PQQ-binding-like beta-propeller repeat protein [Rubripirellula sp.]